jgi:hypothetical protein
MRPIPRHRPHRPYPRRLSFQVAGVGATVLLQLVDRPATCTGRCFEVQGDLGAVDGGGAVVGFGDGLDQGQTQSGAP